MKTINYRGMTFKVDERFKYIATDDDGSVWVYEFKPEYNHGYYGWMVVGGDYLGFGDNYRDIEHGSGQAEDSLENI